MTCIGSFVIDWLSSPLSRLLFAIIMATPAKKSKNKGYQCTIFGEAFSILRRNALEGKYRNYVAPQECPRCKQQNKVPTPSFATVYGLRKHIENTHPDEVQHALR